MCMNREWKESERFSKMRQESQVTYKWMRLWLLFGAPVHFSAYCMHFHRQGPSWQIIAGLQRAGVEASLYAQSHVRPSCAPNLEMQFSLWNNGGSSCLRQEEGNLVGHCRILNTSHLTPFQAAAGLLTGGWARVWEARHRSLLRMNQCNHNITIVRVIALTLHL